jgi:antitoxin component of RelBE/YafQ-DinJ toxin-antitoxin module
MYTAKAEAIPIRMRTRDRQINIRMSDAEVARLQSIADRLGVTGADVVRLMLSRAHDESVHPLHRKS